MAMELTSTYSVRPIGFMKSVFHYKNGTPRQSSLCQAAKGILKVEKSVFNNPEHSLDGLNEFSHAWIIFVFHKNNKEYNKAKVKPPRLNGRKVGVFSTRSPYRPNSIGLSLVKIDLIEGSSIHLSGIDILDGTPVLDIKPYIPEYDTPLITREMYGNTSFSCKTEELQFSEGDSDCCDAVIHTPNTAEEDGINTDQLDIDSQNVYKASALKTASSETSSSLSQSLSLDSNKSTSKQLSRHGEPENELETTKSDSGSSVHPVTQGFYALSAALNKAGTEISSKLNQSVLKDETLDELDCERKSPTEHNSLHHIHTTSDHFESSETSQTDSNNDPFVDFLVGNVIAKAASDLSHSNDDSQRVRSSPSSDSIAEDGMYNICHDLENSSTSNSSDLYESNSSDCLTSAQCVSVTESDTPLEKSKPQLQGKEIVEVLCDENKSTVTAPWLLNPPVHKIKVSFTSDAMNQLQLFSVNSLDDRYRLQMLSDSHEAKSAIDNILHEEPRSIYRRRRCQDSLYHFAIDALHVTCWFDQDAAQVVRIKPVKDVPCLNKVKVLQNCKSETGKC